MSARRAALTTALVALALHGAARANPADVYGLGARAAGMASAQTAATDDASANYYNPAALAATRGALQLDVGYHYATPTLRLDGVDQHVDDARGLYAGLVVPGEVLGVRIAFGVAMYLPDERLTRVLSLAAAQPRFIAFDNRPQRLLLSTNLALRIAPGLYLGGGLSYMSRTEGDVTLAGRVGFPDAAASDLRLDVAVDLVAIRYPQAGLLWVPRDGIAVGLTYRHEFVLELDQGFVVKGDVGAAGLDPILKDGFLALRSLSTDLFQPMTVSAGLALRPASGLLVTADLAYARWSRFRAPGARISLAYDLKQFNDLVDLPRLPPPGDPGFHDVLVPRLGVERALSLGERFCLLLRGGYAYEPSPVPEQFGDTSFADGDKQTFALGVGLDATRLLPALPRRLSLDAHAALFLVQTRTTRKASAVDLTGDYTVSGRVLATGLTLRAEF